MGMENIISEPTESVKSQEELELEAALEESDDDISEVDPDEINEILDAGNDREPEVIEIDSDGEDIHEDQRVPDLKTEVATQNETKDTTSEDTTLYSSKKVVIISFDEYMRRYNLVREHMNRSKAQERGSI